MTVAAVKEKLHQYIDHADDKKVQAIAAFVENDIEHNYNIFDDEMMAVLKERRANYLSGKSRTFTVEESMENARNYIARKKNGI